MIGYRLAEAFAEWLHGRARREWYAPDEQLDAATALSPTVMTFHAGPNDVLRRGTDLPDLFRRYDRAVGRVAGGSERRLAEARLPAGKSWFTAQWSGIDWNSEKLQRYFAARMRLRRNPRNTASRTASATNPIGSSRRNINPPSPFDGRR